MFLQPRTKGSFKIIYNLEIIHDPSTLKRVKHVETFIPPISPMPSEVRPPHRKLETSAGHDPGHSWSWHLQMQSPKPFICFESWFTVEMVQPCKGTVTSGIEGTYGFPLSRGCQSRAPLPPLRSPLSLPPVQRRHLGPRQKWSSQQLGTGNLTGWHLRPQVPTKMNVHMVHMLVLNRLILTGYEPKNTHASWSPRK